MLEYMSEALTVPFSSQDLEDLEEWKSIVSENEVEETPVKRHRIKIPKVEASTEKAERAVEDALDSGSKIPRGNELGLPKDLIESAKSAFIATGGNISEVAALYDLTPEAVLRLASQEMWPTYGGSTKVTESKSKAQLSILKDKLWRKLEKMLDSMDVEEKQKEDIVQYRAYSKYVEPLSSRSSAFKALMDQYMRVSTLLEPEVFANDPDGTNWHARNARGENYPGGVEGVNREIADFLSEVVVGVADKMKDRELEGYGRVIDARVR